MPLLCSNKDAIEVVTMPDYGHRREIDEALKNLRRDSPNLPKC